MKKLIFALTLIVSMAGFGFSQEANLYTFFVNFVSEDFDLPLVGLLNIARGDHDKVQLGLVNWNTKDFLGVQASLMNTTGGNLSGTQLGLTNLSIGEATGLQGGLLNAAKSVNGVQLGLVNTTLKLKGFQFGLINYADSSEDGIPIGLLSIVRKGGYHAVEYSFSEFHPVTISLKLGVEKFYKNLQVAYDPSGKINADDFATGMGFGSILNINQSLFFNPELNYLNTNLEWDYDDDDEHRRITTHDDDSQHILSFTPNIGYNINKNFSITAGPSVSWVYGEDGDLENPMFAMYEYEINDEHNIVVGARISARFRF
jgi:hypothetical protein